MMEHKIHDKRMEKGEQTRARILNAAMIIIAEHGIKEVSAAKLATATGMSKSNIFHHFKSIDEILFGVLHIIFDDLLQPMTQEYRDLEEFLNMIGQSVFHVPEEYLNLFKAFFSFYHEGMFNSEYQKVLTACTDQITDLIYKQLSQLASNAIPQETLASVATLLISMMDGMGLHYLLNGNRLQYEHAWRLQVQFISRLLLEQEYPV
jgi:AcrR family transcriptional regulator